MSLPLKSSRKRRPILWACLLIGLTACQPPAQAQVLRIGKLKDWESLLGRAGAGGHQRPGDKLVRLRGAPPAWVFVLVAPEADAFYPLIDKLAAAPEIFEGLL